ncbi:unnamed protein product [Vitrella brassicaformis CCMP3155]|uniref:Uncharacterized protein n=2 Tax=Vitrella brassicaformis TaxID=1169539 RepID=A0A0G4EJA4_VITBC|nr:unnamed protein product [Vitrella brassicaformis CCMP3155]|mmetsp:Transcript_27251/g.67985  ORF Transcript_27251/g.67985 Transcript_27251/m.67985 type:complete len:205 (+) Transcript_27251:186-800(+)|eukprot:CEL96000.1 unnamed protein product [Vitrella brassicaformis CCMP3155]
MIKPRTRAERNALRDRESLEKERLRNRTGGFHRYEDPGNLIQPIKDDPKNPTLPNPIDRFVRTAEVAELEREDRKREQGKRDQFHENRRMSRESREEQRWRRMEEREECDKQRVQNLQMYSQKAFKNRSGAPFDIVTLRYDQSEEGRRLQHADLMAQYREKVRATNLAYRNHAGFNPILGEQTFLMAMPEKPPVPDADTSKPDA